MTVEEIMHLYSLGLPGKVPKVKSFPPQNRKALLGSKVPPVSVPCSAA
jgi:hypothetical protein